MITSSYEQNDHKRLNSNGEVLWQVWGSTISKQQIKRDEYLLYIRNKFQEKNDDDSDDCVRKEPLLYQINRYRILRPTNAERYTLSPFNIWNESLNISSVTDAGIAKLCSYLIQVWTPNWILYIPKITLVTFISSWFLTEIFQIPLPFHHLYLHLLTTNQ